MQRRMYMTRAYAAQGCTVMERATYALISLMLMTPLYAILAGDAAWLLFGASP
ncbi:MAG TPA: hypothetical protein V6D08_09855 [Candidatus Obscuribacterales bacterium]